MPKTTSRERRVPSDEERMIQISVSLHEAIRNHDVDGLKKAIKKAREFGYHGELIYGSILLIITKLVEKEGWSFVSDDGVASPIMDFVYRSA